MDKNFDPKQSPFCCPWTILHSFAGRRTNPSSVTEWLLTATDTFIAGVSNFDIDELAELLAMARIHPALVQRHSDPLSADLATQALCQLAGVQYQVVSATSDQQA